MMSEKQLRDKVVQLERDLSIYKIILDTPKDGKMGRPKGSITYPKEQLIFLQECELKKMNDREIITEFNKKFGTNLRINSRQLYNIMQRQGIKKKGETFYVEDFKDSNNADRSAQ